MLFMGGDIVGNGSLAYGAPEGCMSLPQSASTQIGFYCCWAWSHFIYHILASLIERSYYIKSQTVPTEAQIKQMATRSTTQ